MAANEPEEKGPTPPDGFGREDITWRPSPDHDPIQVATLHLQHLLIAAARQACPRVRPGSDLTGRALAGLLGTPASVRPAEKRLSGAQPLRLDDIVRLALSLGDDILAALPRHAADLFPEPYHPLLHGWEPGHGTLPTFQRRSPDDHDWASTITRLASFLDTETDAGRDHLLTPGAVTHALAAALTECGTDPSTIELDDHPLPDQAVRTLAIGPATALASLAYLPDQPGRPRVTTERIAGILYATADRDADNRIAILVAGPAATRQLRTHLPDILDVAPGTPFTVRFQTVTRAPASGSVLDDLDTTVLGRTHQPRSTVVAALITKRR